MIIATETRLSAQNHFLLLSEKISSYTWWWWKKSLIEVPSLFGHLKMSENSEESVKMQQKIWKKWVLPSQTLWNVRTYHHHTSYYTDHRFPIINTNRFVIHRCEFYLLLNQTVLFICCMTNLSSMRKLSLFRTLQNYNFIASTITSVKKHRVSNSYQSPCQITDQIAKKSHAFYFDSQSYERNTPQFSTESAE